MAGIIQTKEGRGFLDLTVNVPGSIRAEDPEVRAAIPTISQVLDTHRDALDFMESIDDAIEELIAEKGLFELERDVVEDYYAAKIDLLHYLAGSFHPLTSYGRYYLDQADDAIKEFFTYYGPMVTRITLENVRVFKNVLSKDMMEEVAAGKCMAIGALRTDKKTKKVYGAGALVYYLDRDLLGDDIILRIKWLYVDKAFRGMRLGSFLLGYIIRLVAFLEMDGVTCDIPVECDDAERLAVLFDSWKFNFVNGISPEFIVILGDIADQEKVARLGKGAVSFKESGVNKELMIKKFLEKSSYTGYLNDPILPGAYINSVLSCFLGDPANPEAMLLAHRCPSGKLSVEYCDSLSDEGRDTKRFILLCHFLNVAMDKCDSESVVEFSYDSEELGEELEKVFPNQVGDIIMEGILRRPDDGDLTREDVMQLLETPADELESFEREILS